MIDDAEDIFLGTFIVRPDGIRALETRTRKYTDKRGIKITDHAPVDDAGVRYGAQTISGVLMVAEDGSFGLWTKNLDDAAKMRRVFARMMKYARNTR